MEFYVSDVVTGVPCACLFPPFRRSLLRESFYTNMNSPWLDEFYWNNGLYAPRERTAWRWNSTFQSVELNSCFSPPRPWERAQTRCLRFLQTMVPSTIWLSQSLHRHAVHPIRRLDYQVCSNLLSPLLLVNRDYCRTNRCLLCRNPFQSGSESGFCSPSCTERARDGNGGNGSSGNGNGGNGNGSRSNGNGSAHATGAASHGSNVRRRG